MNTLECQGHRAGTCQYLCFEYRSQLSNRILPELAEQSEENREQFNASKSQQPRKRLQG
jgi:hypothetical protein